uniref:Release factor glutamine methyltransferase n=1 Tax=Candidatus Kentrum sp. LFY TaxID=2126342 RepID=A0A450U7Z4_9GAMM|nr:MAG: [protein release factor]-glutamine N5-methyltransferase [Candidatus Kentron sp. LFY]
MLDEPDEGTYLKSFSGPTHLEAGFPSTLRSALEQAVRLLDPASPSARADTEILLGHVLGKPRHWPYVSEEWPFSASDYERFQQLIARRISGVPIAYLTGQRGFWSFDLSVTSDTLIPRPETERLVEAALDIIPQKAKWCIADLGTGAGPVALALARERPSCLITATDISETALAIARKNAREYTNLVFRRGDWFHALDRIDYDMIVSNPPYVAVGDPHLTRGDVRFEPPLALIGGFDGLDAIRHIAIGARRHLRPGGWLILEHGFDQGEQVRSFLRKLRYSQVITWRDYGERERVTLACAKISRKQTK